MRFPTNYRRLSTAIKLARMVIGPLSEANKHVLIKKKRFLKGLSAFAARLINMYKIKTIIYKIRDVSDPSKRYE